MNLGNIPFGCHIHKSVSRLDCGCTVDVFLSVKSSAAAAAATTLTDDGQTNVCFADFDSNQDRDSALEPVSVLLICTGTKETRQPGRMVTPPHWRFYTTEYIIQRRLNYEYSLRTWGQIQTHSLQKNKHRGGPASSAGCPGKNRGEILASNSNYESVQRCAAIYCDITAHFGQAHYVFCKKTTTMVDHWAVFVLMTLRLRHQNADLSNIAEKPSGRASYLFVHCNRMSTRRRAVFVYVPACSCNMWLHRQPAAWYPYCDVLTCSCKHWEAQGRPFCFQSLQPERGPALGRLGRQQQLTPRWHLLLQLWWKGREGKWKPREKK